MVIVENLTKKYGKFQALDGINLQIPKGEIYGFVGPNGAGKTTTMKVLAGLTVPNSGYVEINGIDIRRFPRRYKQYIGYMPDYFGVYDDLRVCEYLHFYAQVQDIDSDRIPNLIDGLLNLVNLSDKSDAFVNALSRGMQQRLCLARALLHSPELLILDEPASGLDPKARIEMMGILRELMQMGKTILISSHILPELAELCTYIGILEKGKMVISGSVDEILKKLIPKRRVRVKVLEDRELLIKTLLEIPQVSNITTPGSNVEFELDGDEIMIAKLQKYFVERGFTLIFCGEIEGNLETAFLEIVKGRLNEEVPQNASDNKWEKVPK